MKTSVQKKKAGRKATGLRELSPEAARLVVVEAAVGAVQAAVALDRKIAAQTGHSGPTLLRLLRQDVQLTQVQVANPASGELEMQAVVRATGDQLVSRMERAGFPANLIRTAVNFAADVERARVGGGLVANWSPSGGGYVDHALLALTRMERLLAASRPLNLAERAAVWAFCVFGLPLTDIGWMVGGARIARSSLGDVAFMAIEAALERMEPHYLAQGNPASQGLQIDR